MSQIAEIGKYVENENGIARGILCAHSVHQSMLYILNPIIHFIAQKTNESLRVKWKELQAINEQLIAKDQQQKVVNEGLKAEIERLKDEVAGHEEERQKAQMKIAGLGMKVKELSLAGTQQKDESAKLKVRSHGK